MEFIFYGQHINTNGDPKQIERDIYDIILYYHSFNNPYGYKDWKSILNISSITFLYHLGKGLYVRLKLVEEPFP